MAITLDLSGGQPGGTRLGQCCTPGPVPAENNTPNAHCQNVSRKRHELAFDLASRPVKRGTIDDPLRQMSFRHGSWRTRLSPHLLADFLLNDFQFSYRYGCHYLCGSKADNKMLKLPTATIHSSTTMLESKVARRSESRNCASTRTLPCPRLRRTLALH